MFYQKNIFNENIFYKLEQNEQVNLANQKLLR